MGGIHCLRHSTSQSSAEVLAVRPWPGAWPSVEPRFWFSNARRNSGIDVRGEFLTPWGVAEAKKLGIFDLLCEKVAQKIPWVDFFAANTLTAHRDVVATTPHQ